MQQAMDRTGSQMQSTLQHDMPNSLRYTRTTVDLEDTVYRESRSTICLEELCQPAAKQEVDTANRVQQDVGVHTACM